MDENMKKVTGYLLKCSSCGKEYFIIEEEANWYIEKEWPIPKRCKVCRKARKKINVVA